MEEQREKKETSDASNSGHTTSPEKNSGGTKSSATAVQNKPLSPRDLTVPASPPKFFQLEDIMRMAGGVSDMTLAHEIAIGDNFHFQHVPPPENSLESQVREVMHKAFWDVLEDKLKEDPPDYSQALLLLQEVKENLLQLLLPQHQRIRENIEEVLDLQLIEQKAEHGVLDISYYANFVIGIMSRLCAPVRDEQIQGLKQLSGIVPIYKEIFNILRLMKLDMVNYTIDAVRPYVQQHSVIYEKEKFKELVKTQAENGLDGLQFTKAWLSRSAAKHAANSSLASSSSTSLPGASAESCVDPMPDSGKRQYNDILTGAYMELLEWDEENEIFPETLLVDRQRFLDLRNRFGWLVLVSSILIVTYNTVGQAISGIADLKQKLKAQIEVLTNDLTPSQIPEAVASVSEQVNKEVNQCLEEHAFKRLTEDQEKLLKGQIMAIIDPNNAIFKLMKSRLFDCISSIIANPRSGNLQIPAGFSAVADEITKASGQFLRLIMYNQSVFGSFYSDIVSAILASKAS